jgi:hypothetical protein
MDRFEAARAFILASNQLAEAEKAVREAADRRDVIQKRVEETRNILHCATTDTSFHDTVIPVSLYAGVLIRRGMYPTPVQITPQGRSNG